jgi:uncharacterized membrane protein YozB (DUF420 family)
MDTVTPLSPPVRTRSEGRVASRIGWGWITFSAVTVVVMALTPYLTTSLSELADANAGIASTYADQPLPIVLTFYAHVGFGAIALLIGPLQFARGLRERFPRVHRVLGSISVGAIVLAAVAGLVISPLTRAGIVGTLGFGILAVLWASFALLGLRAILRRDVQAHRAWMTRAFALTYAAVTLRLWIPILMMGFIASGTDPAAAFTAAYAIVPFLCWIPNLILAEWLVRRRAQIVAQPRVSR